jgi:queuine/archaeosine tRNA-ribosyltransferase
MADIRQAIKEKRFLEFKETFYTSYGLNESESDF